MREININRQKLGLEDLTFGVGTETQRRAGQSVLVTKINVGNLPFDETQSLLEWAQSVNLEELGNMYVELQAIYNNLSMIGNVEDNLVMLNAVEDSLTMLNSIYSNISKIQNVDTNMAKIQNIDTHMAELSTIYTNLVMLQAVYNNLTMLDNVENNLVTINAVNTNLIELLAIYTQVVPNLTELLQVNENAAQVAADKLTVAVDKLTVANDKADVSIMKSAVESIYDSFDDRFLGAKITDPTVDNDGNPLVDGALYFNSSAHALKVYSLTDTTWYTIPQIYLSGLLDVQLTSITTGDILNWNGTKWVNTRTPKFSTMQLTGGTGTEGTLSWNTDEGTVDIILPNGSILQVGQEGIRKVRNGTASTITNGTVVMFDGTIGNSGRIKVKPFTGGFNEALYVYGIATQDILAGTDGIITTEGKIRGINTTGSLVGETWADEDILYAKPSNAGALTKVVPGDSQLKMVMASVIHAHTSGTLEIRFTPINENTWYTKVQADALVDIHSKTAKTTPVDADEFMTADSTSTWSLKKITWASIKDALASLFMNRVSITTDNAIARYDGTTGQVQNSGVIIDDLGQVILSNTNSSPAWSNGSFSFHSVVGSTLRGKAGSVFDISLYNAGGTKALFTHSIANGNISLQDGKFVVDLAGNIGVGVPTSNWNPYVRAVEIENGGHLAFTGPYAVIGETNAYYNAAGNYIYKISGASAHYSQIEGTHYWKTAPSGTAGNAITWENNLSLRQGGILNLSGSVNRIEIGRDSSGSYSAVNGFIQCWSNNLANSTYMSAHFASDTYEIFQSTIGGVKKSAILANGSFQSATNAYGSTSDIKLKENIVDTSPKLDKLMKVQVRNFNYIGQEDSKQIGVIAQEIEQIFPSVVFETKDTKQIEVQKERIIPAVEEVKDDEGNVVQQARPESVETYTETETVETGEVTKNVKYSVIYMMMLKGMQEQQEIIKDLRARIEILENK